MAPLTIKIADELTDLDELPTPVADGVALAGVLRHSIAEAAQQIEALSTADRLDAEQVRELAEQISRWAVACREVGG